MGWSLIYDTWWKRLMFRLGWRYDAAGNRRQRRYRELYALLPYSFDPREQRGIGA